MPACPSYRFLPGLVGGQDLINLQMYFRQLLAAGGLHWGDEQCPMRWTKQNDEWVKLVHDGLVPLLSDVVGEKVRPSYSFSVVYEKGAELVRHTDRAQCHYSLSLALDFEPEIVGPTPWALWLETSEGDIPFNLANGDGLFFRGTELPHFRTLFDCGERATVLFLHYVPFDFVGSLD